MSAARRSGQSTSVFRLISRAGVVRPPGSRARVRCSGGLDGDGVGASSQEIRHSRFRALVEGRRAPVEPLPDLRRVREERACVAVNVGLEAGLGEHAVHRLRREEPNVRIAPGLLDRLVVAERIEATEQKELEPAAPVRDVRKRQEQNAARFEDAVELRRGLLRLEQMLEDFDCEKAGERAVGEGQIAGVGDDARIEPVRLGLGDRGLGDVDAVITAPVVSQPDSRRAPVPAADVQPGLVGPGVAFEDSRQFGERSRRVGLKPSAVQ